MARIPRIKKDWKLFTTKKKRNVKKWVEALESGEYGQCYGKLASGGKYCCLGVADVVVPPKGRDYTARRVNFGLRHRGGCVDLDDQDGTDYDVQPSLVYLNDTLRLDFKQIATFIRKMWKHQYGEEL